MLQHQAQNNTVTMGQANRYLTTGEVSRESIEQLSSNNFLEPQHYKNEDLNHRYSLPDKASRESIEFSSFKNLKEPHFFLNDDTQYPSIRDFNLEVNEYISGRSLLKNRSQETDLNCRVYQPDAGHLSFNNGPNSMLPNRGEHRETSYRGIDNNKLFSFELPHSDVYPHNDDGSSDCEGEDQTRDEVSPLDSDGLLRQRVKKRLFNASLVCY